MWSSLAIAVVLAVALTAALILLPHAAAHVFGRRCLKCGHRPLDQFDGEVFYDPPPEWSLFRCAHCGADFIRSIGEFTPRSQWSGDPEAEHMFQQLESDSCA